ncbi:helix-turn-helix domain-containing protein [Peristeroidobacter agariperforans]|uniref:helix-turn-helix domain-containing protein n=1 Tax=Peristeroidobacter agariperforans TaxID=268404 RepID=UPI00101CF1CF|nr:helix-turn-helix domain-containing protein [Peristeroidobacter agariperforans]
MSQQTNPESIVAQHFARAAVALARPREPAPRDRKFIEAVARGMSIFEAFGQRGGPLSNADLHELTGLSKPTVTRLTHTLLTLGYLRRTKNNRFQLSPGVMTLVRPLGDAVAARLPSVALNAIASTGPWCITVAEPANEALVVTASFSSYQAGTPVCSIGTCLDLSLTSAGQAFLAALPLEASHIRVNGQHFPKLEIIGAARAQLLTKGFCFEANGWRRGVATIAVPVPNQLFAHRVVMAAASDEPTMRDRLAKEIVPAIKSVFS